MRARKDPSQRSRWNQVGVGMGLACVASVIAFAWPQPVSAGSAYRCPVRVANTSTAENAGAALAAAKRFLPRLYLGSDGPIVQLLRLEPQHPELPGASHWRAVARRLCGTTVADQSWAVAAIFPESKIAVPSTGVFFLVLTQTGWLAWYRYR